VRRTNKQFWVGAAFIAVTALLIRLGVEWNREPVIRGETLSWWLTSQEFLYSDEFIAASAEMDDRCVRYLIRELDWSPPIIRTKLNSLLSPIFHRSVFPTDRRDCRAAAATVLARLGSRAQPAIPALRACAATPRGKSAGDTFARSTAVVALVLLGADSVDSCMDKLLDPKNPYWMVYALVTAHLRTNAAVAVPRLVHAFETMDDEIKGRIALPLREIRSHPDLSVPVLTALLAHTNDETRFHAAAGLGSFGAAAKPAWNDLVALLSDKSNQARFFTTNSLRQIDREAARQLGIN
jgi:hypothetical protein